MIKRIILILLTSGLLTACGGGGGSASSSTPCSDTAVLGQATFGSGCFK